MAVDVGSREIEEPFRFEHQRWDPEVERWSRYQRSVREKFERELKAYEENLRKDFVAHGAVRARARFKGDNLAWLVLYQLGGLSPTEILRREPKLKGDQSTITKGIKAAAKLLNWNHLRLNGGAAIRPVRRAKRRPTRQ